MTERQRRASSGRPNGVGLYPGDFGFTMYESDTSPRQCQRATMTAEEGEQHRAEALQNWFRHCDRSSEQWRADAVEIQPAELSGQPFDWDDEDAGVPFFEPRRLWDN